jgi:hypothetical protein
MKSGLKHKDFNANMSTGKGNAMSEFKNVSVVKKANVYFDGKVTSQSSN